ncbi:TAXI family TRAP transporter solute-binding subunit [Fodinicurvata sp. EGI_FJ10296]|uniref:TAXI family TRAP transporter solute-binding subunit n=1 Tax=Fodinicurvata sp. EGI_FJ10296 TaxID=3231908 RepID=UPI003455EB3C
MRALSRIALTTMLAAPIAVGTGVAPSIADAQDFVRIATAGSGGNYYRLGSGLASIWNDTVEGVQASVQATGGSVENLDLLADQEVEIAYLAGGVGIQAYENTGTFEDRPADRYQGLRSIGTVYPNPQWFLAMEWAPEIESIRDLEGMRVAVGMAGGQGEAWWRMTMDHLGWTYDDIEAEYTFHDAAIDQVRNRQIDAVVSPDAPGSATIQQMMDTGFARIIDIDEDIIEFFDESGLDYPYTVSAQYAPGRDEPVETFASPITFSTHEGVSEDLVYELTKSMFENRERLIEVHPLAELMTIEDALDGLPFPLHPGAERFYEEQGVL